MAVVTLVLLAVALALGTFCEAKYGTPAAQHYFYRAVWFQILLFLLAVNLVVSALHRLPWQRRHVGFVTTHLGIILILIGNVFGIWFGIEGQLFIPEGKSEADLRLTRDLLWIQPQNPGTPFTFPLDFGNRPWIQNVNRTFSIPSDGKPITVVVDRYLPNARVEEKVVVGEEEFPAVRLELTAAGEAPQEAWLFSRDPERFGFRWGEAHVFFLEVRTEEELLAIEHPDKTLKPDDKGILYLEFPKLGLIREIPVNASLGKTIPIEGTPYTLSLKDYFADFAITEGGPTSRSDSPQNPALAFLLKGPEGEDPFLVFALHPEFEERHGIKRVIFVKATYEMQTTLPPLPPALVGIIRSPKEWRVVMTSPDGSEQKLVPLTPNETYTHPWLDLSFRILEHLPKVRLVQEFYPKDNEVRQQAIHVVVGQEEARREGWISHGGVSHLEVGNEMVVLAYQPAKHELPFSVKLLDFRKKEYPGTSVPSAFESDVEIEDTRRGLHLSKTISMNHPLTYRGYTMFQASFFEGPVETTVLAVRNDPGTPFVYLGFVTVILGVSLMFYLKAPNRRKTLS